MPHRKLPIAPKFGPADVVRVVGETSESVLAEGTPAATRDAGASAVAWVDELVTAVQARLPMPRAQACDVGCAYCCHLKVLVSAPEVLALAAHLGEALAPDVLDALRARVAAADAKTHGLSIDERTALRQPCPLLDEAGKCLGYAARPASCRGANSFDAAACEAAFRGAEAAIPLYKPQHQIAEAVRVGLAGGAMARGLDGRPLELVAALRVALGAKGVAEAWTRGQPVFEPALDAEADAMIRALMRA
jgi:hypothetical protein